MYAVQKDRYRSYIEDDDGVVIVEMIENPYEHTKAITIDLSESTPLIYYGYNMTEEDKDKAFDLLDLCLHNDDDTWAAKDEIIHKQQTIIEEYEAALRKEGA